MWSEPALQHVGETAEVEATERVGGLGQKMPRVLGDVGRRELELAAAAAGERRELCAQLEQARAGVAQRVAALEQQFDERRAARRVAQSVAEQLAPSEVPR